MSTSERGRPGRLGRPALRPAAVRCRDAVGLSLIELLLALALGLCLALAVAPLWTSFQALGARETDKTIWTLQARVAAGRLERDLRAATAEGCPFPVDGPVLQATSSQVVLLVRKDGSAAPILVEWELTAGALMRRWGPCPAQKPLTYAHSLYSDSKTMLEGIASATSAFGYYRAGVGLEAPALGPDLAGIDGVSLMLGSGGASPGVGESVRVFARVGR
jgi:type II secretory pathway component PulJ